jgi:type IV pilus assembly protein PilC
MDYMMQDDTHKLGRFAYQAQTTQGRTLSGVIEAATVDEARESLQDMNLRVIEIEQTDRAKGASPLRGGEFMAFNQQLAQLTAAGLPVEVGLRLIARDMRSGRLSESVRRVASELEAGASLPDAFEKHRRLFPPLYGRLIDAGVKSNHLPGVLFNLGRHMELMQRLRGTLWRAASYPMIILLGVGLVLVFLGHFIVPQFEEIFQDFDANLPMVTMLVFNVAKWILPIAIGIGAAIVLVMLAIAGLRATGKSQAVADYLLMPLPLIGTVLRRNLVARWCDALKLGVQSGLDLPASLELAGDAVASPLLKRDGQALIQTIESGKPLNEHPRLLVAPEAVPAAIHLASHQHDLPSLLDNLSQMYQQQAELRLATLQSTLAPILLILLAGLIGSVISALFLPLVHLMQAVM